MDSYPIPIHKCQMWVFPPKSSPNYCLCNESIIFLKSFFEKSKKKILFMTIKLDRLLIFKDFEFKDFKISSIKV